jgi:hypothetical protein
MRQSKESQLVQASAEQRNFHRQNTTVGYDSLRHKGGARDFSGGPRNLAAARVER